jgi:hypothetical protein
VKSATVGDVSVTEWRSASGSTAALNQYGLSPSPDPRPINCSNDDNYGHRCSSYKPRVISLFHPTKSPVRDFQAARPPLV